MPRAAWPHPGHWPRPRRTGRKSALRGESVAAAMSGPPAVAAPGARAAGRRTLLAYPGRQGIHVVCDPPGVEALHVATLNIRNLADRWSERLALLLADMSGLQP